MKRLALVMALAALPIPVFAADYSTTLTTTPVQVIPAATSQPRSFLRIINVEPLATGVSAWCSRSLTATLAPNAPGAYEVQAGGGLEQYYAPGYVPPNAEWCVAASGTVRVTVEANP